MADAETRPRKRDRLKAGVKRRAKRYVDLPLRLRTSDLWRRLASAAVMLAVAGGALWAGGAVLTAFIGAVALACFVEWVLLIWRAAARPHYRLAGVLAGAAYIALAALALAEMPRFFLVLALGAVIFTDSCAYFAGRTIGGPKIAPAISPSKTWAGLAGGMAGAAVFAAGFAALAPASLLPEGNEPLPLGFAVLGAVLAIAAQVGDFFESWLKRRARKKDSSNLIPGHGGVFDRVDGLLPVAIIVGLIAPGLA